MAQRFRYPSPSPFAPTAALPVRPFVRRVAPDVVTADVLPEVAIDKPCQRKFKRGHTGPKTLRPCHVELALVGEARSREYGVRPGQYLRGCSRFGRPGRLIPIAGVDEALAVSRRYCGCLARQRGRGRRDACAVEVGGDDRFGRAR